MAGINEYIKQKGSMMICSNINKPILGRVDIETSVVISKDLKVIPSELPEKHADITGWPEEKSEQKQIALRLDPDLEATRENLENLQALTETI